MGEWVIRKSLPNWGLGAKYLGNGGEGEDNKIFSENRKIFILAIILLFVKWSI